MQISPVVPEADRHQRDMRLRSVARGQIEYTDAEIVDHIRRLGYEVDYSELAFTTESVEDFAEARLRRWYRPGHLVTLERHGLLIVEGAQPHPRQRSRDVVVVSLGARVIMGALNPPDRTIGVPRYAETM